jgi:hypothetical protein
MYERLAVVSFNQTELKSKAAAEEFKVKVKYPIHSVGSFLSRTGPRASSSESNTKVGK